ncbi:hypothetical protein WN944_027139 [Citrus x changshan-huyou]|uniref:Uncharacterized protein n=1 Tax=Citrus x changshan-huyou TaxID=2935761 RepID=A0AAP0LGZ5_9ROSI
MNLEQFWKVFEAIDFGDYGIGPNRILFECSTIKEDVEKSIQPFICCNEWILSEKLFSCSNEGKMIATLATYASEAQGSSQKPENKRAGMSKSKKNKNGKGDVET